MSDAPWIIEKESLPDLPEKVEVGQIWVEAAHKSPASHVRKFWKVTEVISPRFTSNFDGRRPWVTAKIELFDKQSNRKGPKH